MKKIAVFASGAGSNAEKIIDRFKGSRTAEVALILSNNQNAGVLNIAKKNKIPSIVLKKEIYQTDGYSSFLVQNGIDFVILAGFLLKVPPPLIEAYPKKIINLHPALLPKYGGKGMYGHFVHTAVLKNNEQESGITIHYVDEIYDHGAIIFQAKCSISPTETSESLSEKIHLLEHKHFPAVIEELVNTSD